MPNVLHPVRGQGRELVFRAPSISESIFKVVDASASTTTAELGLYRVPTRARLTGLRFVPEAALTANDTNNAVITVRRRPVSAPGTPATIVAYTTNVAAGNWTAWTAVALAAVNLLCEAGDYITVEIAKSGSGVVVPKGNWVVDFTPAMDA